jgi:tetratricopeptide (TPR) repeat protein
MLLIDIASPPEGSRAGSGQVLEGEVNLTAKGLKEILNTHIEPANPIVHDEALLLVAPYPGAYTIDAICSIYRHLKKGEGTIIGWSYKNDPRGSEYFNYANESLRIGDRTSCAGAGDCDDFAILMSGLIESIGGTTRIVLTHNNSTGGHAYTEVYLGQLDSPNSKVNNTINWLEHEFGKEGIYCHLNTTTKDVWLNLDWGQDAIGNAHPGGPFSQGDMLIIFPIKESFPKESLEPPLIVNDAASQSPAVPLNITIAVLENGSAEVWFNKGIALNDLGKYDDAMQAFDKAIELDPKFALPWNNKGLILDNQGKLDEAIKAYDEATSLDPNFALAWNNKGNVLKAQGKYDEAIEAYGEAIRSDPNFAWAWNGKGLALYNKGLAFNNQGKLDEAIKAYDEAISAYTEALKIEPNHPEAKTNLAQAWNNKGNALKAQPGKQDEAIKAYEEAIRLNPNLAWAWNGKGLALNDKGIILCAEGNFDEANEAYDESINAFIEAIKIEPNHPEAQTNLDKARDNKDKCPIPPSLKIISPKDNDSIQRQITVSGTITGKLPKDSYVWIMVNPTWATDQWWPQGGRHIQPIKGNWSISPVVVGNDSNSGKEFNIAAILVDKAGDNELKDWVSSAEQLGYPSIPLPDNAEIMDAVTVRRI